MTQQNSRPHRATRTVFQAFYQDECEIAIVSGLPEGKQGRPPPSLSTKTYVYLVCKDYELLKVMWRPTKKRELSQIANRLKDFQKIIDHDAQGGPHRVSCLILLHVDASKGGLHE